MAYNKYTKELLEPVVAKSISMLQVMREVGVKPTGGSHSHLSRRIRDFGLDTSHFLGQRSNLGKTNPRRRRPEEILVLRTEWPRAIGSRLTQAMLEVGVKHVCAICGIGPEWRGEKLTLQVDHIDGNPLDSRIENVRFICPNCHSQTHTWGNKRGITVS